MALSLGGVRSLFRAVVTTVVPEARELSPDAWTEVEQIVERALSERPASVGKQVRAFLKLLNVVAFVRHGRGLAQLDASQRLRLLERLSASRMLLVRRGVWGVRTLAFMGYYARPVAAREIGYRAAAGGWSVRRSASGNEREGGAGVNA